MRNKVWLLALTLLVVYSGRVSGNDSHFRSALVAQQVNKKVVTGVVSDDMGPVIGATVSVKGTTNGVVTDLDGNFKLTVPVGATLVISFIGYEDKEIVYKGEPQLNVKLSENVTALEEVQVIAYGSAKKVTITGALSSVKSDEIMKSPVGSIANALSGKVPGLSSVQSSGQPGADDATIYVRGVGSLSTNLSSPLCLVDGVERSFSQLDPNEVEDITVLKDASATAVFGVRGANGVILVTTKRGSEGKAKVSFSTSAALQLPTRIPDFANSYDYANAFNNAQLRDGVLEENLTFTPEMLEAFRTHSNPIMYSDTDWTDMLIKNSAWQTQHNFNISGGSKRVKYFASLGIYTQDGLFNMFDTGDYDSGFKYNRYNYRVNMDVDVTKTTSMKINLGGRLTDKREPNYDNGTSKTVAYLFRDVYWTPPFAGPGIVDGKWVTLNETLYGGFGKIYDALNSYYGKGYNTIANNVINFDFSLQQKLDMITKGLKVHIKGAYNSGVSITKKREGRAARYEAFLGENDEILLKKTQETTTLSYNESTGQSRDWYLEAALNYSRKFGHHNVSALAMYNQSMKYYYSDKFPGIPRSYVGLVGRATYDYKTRYMVDFSVGYNGSENFAEGKRFGFFPAGSAGWILSEERFMSSLKPYLSYMKVRASYGIVGNDRVSDGSRFLYLPDSYIISSGNYGFGSSNDYKLPGAIESKIGNPNVTWETASKQNYGVDMHFFDGHLKTSFDYFVEHCKDILLTRKLDPGYLAVKLPTVNMGKVDNKGFEVTARWEDKIQNVSYYVGTSWSYAKNKIIFQDEIPQPYEWMEQTGRPVGQQFGYVTDGFFSQEDVEKYVINKGMEGGIPDHNFSPKAGDVKYRDLNGDYKIDDKDVAAIGYPKYPLLTGNMSLGFSWNGLDFSMVWSGAFKTSRLVSSFYRVPFDTTNNRALLSYMIKDAWTPEKGNSSTAPAISFGASKANNYKDSDLWLRDASYVRLKNIELGYSFPKQIVKKMHLGTLRLSVSGYNLLTFDDMGFCDPESNPDGQAYPLIKVVNFGLKVGF